MRVKVSSAFATSVPFHRCRSGSQQQVTIKNSDQETWRGNSSPFCFLLFNIELHLNVRNLEKASPLALVSPVGPEKSE